AFQGEAPAEPIAARVERETRNAKLETIPDYAWHHFDSPDSAGPVGPPRRGLRSGVVRIFAFGAIAGTQRQLARRRCGGATGGLRLILELARSRGPGCQRQAK